jgi:hypothetical protein
MTDAEEGMLAALRTGTAGPASQYRAARRIKDLSVGFDDYAQYHVEQSARIRELEAELDRAYALIYGADVDRTGWLTIETLDECTRALDGATTPEDMPLDRDEVLTLIKMARHAAAKNG